MNVHKKYRIMIFPNSVESRARAIQTIRTITGLSMGQALGLFKLSSFPLCTPDCEGFMEMVFTEEEAAPVISELWKSIQADMVPVNRLLYCYGATVGEPDWDEHFERVAEHLVPG
jgi:hypothetical protein